MTSYNEQIKQCKREKQSVLQCFSHWRELLLDIQQYEIQATGEFIQNSSNWKQAGGENESYYSPNRARTGEINQQADAVYIMGCVLYETLFWKSLWRANRIGSLEQLAMRKEPLFVSANYDAAEYAFKEGETAHEVRFIFQLLETMLELDVTKRPSSLREIASWLGDEQEHVEFYYVQQDDDIDSTPYVGIDLGTTNSVVVLAKRGQLTELVIEGALTVPSAVFYENEYTHYFGKKALSRGINYPRSLATSFKRYMEGVDGHYPDLTYVSGETVETTGMDIAQTYLTWLREQAIKVAKEPLNHAVITVPADFDSRKIESTRRAALGAGFTHVGIEREPNAAGYAYLYAERKTFDGTKNIFVYDFGGGTFDVSILQRTDEQSFDIVGRDGDERLGGDLFNEAIMNWLIDQVQMEHFGFELDLFNYNDERYYFNAKKIIHEAAKEAKHELSTKESVRVRLRQLPISDDEIVPLSFDLTRETFEQLIEPYIAKAEIAMGRAMAQAGILSEEIADVVLAGGTALTPVIKTSVESYFGKLSNKSLNMSTMIARGAALFAMLKWTENKEQSIIQQAAINKVTHDFGVAVKDTHHLAFKELIAAGVTLPYEETASFSTEKDDQESLQIIIGRRSMHAREAKYFNDEAIEVIDKVIVPDLPKAQAGELRVDVTFKFDSIGNLSITVHVKDETGAVLQQKDLVKYADVL